MLPEQLLNRSWRRRGAIWPRSRRKGADFAPQLQKKGGGGPRDQFLNFFRVSE